MKHIWVIMIATAALAVVQQQETKPAPAAKKAPATAPKTTGKKSAAPASKVAASKAAPKKVDPMALPAGAQEIAPNTWRVTDAKGEKWLYYKTPFGFSKALESQQTAAAVETVPEDWKAKDEGDSVTFERPTPFGKNVWTKKKTDLNSTESAVFQRAQRASK